MYVAILHEGNGETSINADEYLERFGARGGRSTWLTCPECGQPVVARGMTPGSWVSPYFKHESNNPVAQECVNYRAGDSYYGGYGYGSVALGEPVDMYLENSDDSIFDLLVEFPAIDSETLEYLELQEAVIRSGALEFPVDAETFAEDSLLYYTVDGPSFGTGIEIELLNVPTWAFQPQLPNIKHTLNGCMLFECLGWERRVKRLDAQSLDFYESDQFTLVCSTATGMETMIKICSISTQFKVVGALDNSSDGEHVIGVARFITSDRDTLKSLFP